MSVLTMTQAARNSRSPRPASAANDVPRMNSRWRGRLKVHLIPKCRLLECFRDVANIPSDHSEGTRSSRRCFAPLSLGAPGECERDDRGLGHDLEGIPQGLKPGRFGWVLRHD